MITTYQLDDYIPSGSCLKGQINTTFQELIDAFGEPNVGPGDKVWNEWSIRFTVPDQDDPEDSDDHYVTIYDWKETNPETSHYGTYRWHIGSKSREAVWLVLDALNSPEDMERLDG